MALPSSTFCPRGHPVRAGVRFCGACGAEVVEVDGNMERLPGSRGRLPPWSVLVASAVGLIVAGVIMALLLAQRSELGRQHEIVRDLAAANGRLEGRIERLAAYGEGLGAQISQLQNEGESDLEPAQVANDALDSVFTIISTGAEGTSQGSGFVATSDAGSSLIVTNFHVVEDAYLTSGSVRIVQGDRTFAADIQRVSQASDVATLRVDVALSPLPMSRNPSEVGEAVVVIGSPRGLEQSVSTGIVSAFRSGLIQFTAPIAPGSSGGPILDTAGEVLGISTSGASAEFAQGVFFAVPSSTICNTVLNCRG